MTSLINLELSRDNLVEQIMASIEEGETEGTKDSAVILAQFDRLESQIADKVDAIAAVVAAKQGEIDYLKSREQHFAHTGNAWNLKGTITSEDFPVARQLIPLCEAICDRHLPGFKCYSNAMKSSSPDPQSLAFYRQTINKVKVSI